MSRYIIILSTVIRTPVDLKRISTAIEGFHAITSWSVDLEDCDQIMRLDCGNDIGHEIVERLDAVGINSSVLEVFNENGVSLPLIQGVQFVGRC